MEKGGNMKQMDLYKRGLNFYQTTNRAMETDLKNTERDCTHKQMKKRREKQEDKG